jgi:hypothetical protein
VQHRQNAQVHPPPKAHDCDVDRVAPLLLEDPAIGRVGHDRASGVLGHAMDRLLAAVDGQKVETLGRPTSITTVRSPARPANIRTTITSFP